jgi:PAS domain S-box-containing protein
MHTLDFGHVFNSLQNHVLIIGTDLKLIAVSEGILKSSGLIREKIVGKNVFDIFTQDPNDQTSFPVSIRTALNEKKLHEMGVIEWKRPEVPTTYWKARSYPVLNQQNEVLYIVHESFEITNEIKKEEILNAVENELLKQTTLTDILDRQSDGFFVINNKDLFTYVNKFMTDFGLMMNTSNLVGRKVKDVFVSSDTDKFLKRYHRIMETGLADHFVETLDGVYLSVDAYPTIEGGVAVFFRDITQRRESEQEILDNRKKLEIITNQIPAFVAYFDSDGRYQFANKSYEHWFGLSSKDIIGKKRSEFATSFTSELAREHESRALSGETIKYQNILHKEDKAIYLDVSYIPDFDQETNKVRGAVVIGYDVSEQELAKIEMEKALKLREDFMSIASHELKTPITSMYLQNQILKRLNKKEHLQKDDV